MIFKIHEMFSRLTREKTSSFNTTENKIKSNKHTKLSKNTSRPQNRKYKQFTVIYKSCHWKARRINQHNYKSGKKQTSIYLISYILRSIFNVTSENLKVNKDNFAKLKNIVILSTRLINDVVIWYGEIRFWSLSRATGCVQWQTSGADMSRIER